MEQSDYLIQISSFCSSELSESNSFISTPAVWQVREKEYPMLQKLATEVLAATANGLEAESRLPKWLGAMIADHHWSER